MARELDFLDLVIIGQYKADVDKTLKFMRSAGFKVGAAQDRIAALKLLSHARPILALVDLMVDKSGITLVEEASVVSNLTTYIIVCDQKNDAEWAGRNCDEALAVLTWPIPLKSLERYLRALQ